MIDHISLAVTDIGRSMAFYDAVLTPLGYRRMMEFDGVAGYGDRHPTLWLGRAEIPETVAPPSGFHLAFVAPNRASVEAFYQAALVAGADDNGAPGLRPHYHPDYYAAFVIDPDGYRIEAVCHQPGG